MTSALDLHRRGLLLTGAAAGLASVAHAQNPASPVARTRHGPVRGYVDQGVQVFKGVRYGADTAPRRFQAPLPPQPWTDTRAAIAYAPSAPQTSTGEGAQSEDCLFLNVWTPALRDGRKRPVMVYIHGGAYANGSGSSPLYDGVNLCRRGDVVVVTVNHRLNAPGYLYLARLGSPSDRALFADSGNAGQLDLHLALRWVRDNIAEFGGDPGRVLAFGQSGGGAKIATMMAAPDARGLFHRAATMSGQQVTASGPLNATQRALAALEHLKLRPDQTRDLLRLPIDRVLEANRAKDPILPYGNVYFGPVLDDRNLHRHPFYPDAAPQGLSIPMIIGNTHDETRAFMGGDPTNFTVSWDGLAAKLSPANMRIDIAPETVVAEYRRLYPAYTPSEVLFAATTAGRSWRAAVIEAEERAKAGAPAWVYQLDWATPRDGGKFGAPHGADIQLVFDNTDKPGATAEGPEAKPMAAVMSETFLAFARTGNPNNRAIPRWDPYTLPRRRTMVFDIPPHAENDPRGAERRLFARVPFIQSGT